MSDYLTAPDVSSPRRLQVRQLGRQSYEPIWRAMQQFTDQRGEHSSDQLWLTEHEPIYTLGQAGKWEHVLAPGDIPVLPVDRGGQVTYHGPGQLMAYALLDLRRNSLGVRALVDLLESTTVALLHSYCIEAELQKDAPGVYVRGQKIMALGLRIRRGASFHGIALNVCMDLEPFSRINPCGYQGLRHTCIADEGGPADLSVVANDLTRLLAQRLSLVIEYDLATAGEHKVEQQHDV
jgi:lipoyl(octanoyl) transferase